MARLRLPVLLLGTFMCCPRGAAAAFNLTDVLSEMIDRIRAGDVPNGFAWGSGLGPVNGEWKGMIGKVAGCLLDKCENIAMQWDVSDNSSWSVDSPPSYFANIAVELASCCTVSSRAGWCAERIAPAYKRLVHLTDVGGADYEYDELELSAVYAIVTKAAADLLEEMDAGFSDRAGLILGACPASGTFIETSCTPEDLERVRRLLGASDEL